MPAGEVAQGGGAPAALELGDDLGPAVVVPGREVQGVSPSGVTIVPTSPIDVVPSAAIGPASRAATTSSAVASRSSTGKSSPPGLRRTGVAAASSATISPAAS
ncbi:hypothetical protein [Litorihabitans aurantiacus]|uniref:hypothetical protein n=1 Tax=Litorihabitans aurantiacus TaxID=1930061 RepID=UPI0024E0FB11|nr:hypothetical protein [Litorihabitans aurantiacus]